MGMAEEEDLCLLFAGPIGHGGQVGFPDLTGLIATHIHLVSVHEEKRPGPERKSKGIGNQGSVILIATNTVESDARLAGDVDSILDAIAQVNKSIEGTPPGDGLPHGLLIAVGVGNIFT